MVESLPGSWEQPMKNSMDLDYQANRRFTFSFSSAVMIMKMIYRRKNRVMDDNVNDFDYQYMY